jgi:DedD protein
MQINGDKFLRNLEIERERAELERQKEELMSQKTQSYVKASNRYKEDEFERELNYQELDDIRLNKDSSNKQKYILLGFILVLLFLITIVTIKLISEPNNANGFGQNDTIDDKKLENGISNVNPTVAEANETKSLDIDKIIQSEDNINPNQETQPVAAETKPAEGDIFGIAKNTEAISVPTPQNTAPAQNVVPQKTTPSTQTTIPQVAQTTPKPTVAPTTQKTVTKEALVIKEAPVKPKVPKEVKKDIIKKSETPKPIVKKEIPKATETTSQQQIAQSGPFYIQVGAFSTVPDKALILELQKGNYKYTFQKLERDGKQYSKLLIGGYSTKDRALEDLLKVRRDINPNAFIPKGQ